MWCLQRSASEPHLQHLPHSSGALACPSKIPKTVPVSAADEFGVDRAQEEQLPLPRLSMF